jgi:hypothetical protein
VRPGERSDEARFLATPAKKDLPTVDKIEAELGANCGGHPDLRYEIASLDRYVTSGIARKPSTSPDIPLSPTVVPSGGRILG